MSKAKITTDETKLDKLLNIGPKVKIMLNEIGIFTKDELKNCGAVMAYIKINQTGKFFGVANNLMLLYALYGASTDQNCLYLLPEIKQYLQEELNIATKQKQ